MQQIAGSMIVNYWSDRALLPETAFYTHHAYHGEHRDVGISTDLRLLAWQAALVKTVKCTRVHFASKAFDTHLPKVFIHSWRNRAGGGQVPAETYVESSAAEDLFEVEGFDPHTTAFADEQFERIHGRDDRVPASTTPRISHSARSASSRSRRPTAASSDARVP